MGASESEKALSDSVKVTAGKIRVKLGKKIIDNYVCAYG
jgi:hypothetical protein